MNEKHSPLARLGVSTHHNSPPRELCGQFGCPQIFCRPPVMTNLIGFIESEKS